MLFLNIQSGFFNIKHFFSTAMAAPKRHNKTKQRLFTNDLKSLLFAFGDSSTPNIETIHMLEDVVTNYLTDIILRANTARKLQKRNKFIEEDLRFALRDDPVKLGRIHDLSVMAKEISRANKMFDVTEKSLTGKQQQNAKNKTLDTKKKSKGRISK